LPGSRRTASSGDHPGRAHPRHRHRRARRLRRGLRAGDDSIPRRRSGNACRRDAADPNHAGSSSRPGPPRRRRAALDRSRRRPSTRGNAVPGEKAELVLDGGAPRGFQSGRLRLPLDGAVAPVDEAEATPMPDEAANVALLYAATRRHPPRHHHRDRLRPRAAAGAGHRGYAGIVARRRPQIGARLAGAAMNSGRGRHQARRTSSLH